MGKYVGAILSVLVAAGIVFGAAAAIGSASHALPTLTAASQGTTSDGLKQVSINLETFPFSPYTDPDFVQQNVTGKDYHGFPYPAPGDNQSWVTYWPTTALKVPAHALVTVTIENYDSPTPLLNPFYGKVQGTVGGTMTVDGKALTEQDPSNVSHTFTIHSIVNSQEPWLYVSVPVTGADPKAKADAAGMPLQPVVTQFSFITPDKPGEYIWQCFDPCGSGYNGFGGPMSTKGYMSGTLSVVA